MQPTPATIRLEMIDSGEGVALYMRRDVDRLTNFKFKLRTKSAWLPVFAKRILFRSLLIFFKTLTAFTKTPC